MGRSIRVAPKQSLGQNFLIDDNIAKKIVRELHCSDDDVVIEIGPGNGALTQHLAGSARRLIAIEIDHRVIRELTEKFSGTGVTILHQDFLETDLQHFQLLYNHKVRIIGNLPYHLTSPILFKIFEEHVVVQDAVFMVQKEVGGRIVAKPGTKEYGILSVCSQFYGVPEMLFTVSPNCFYPKPKVTSAVIRLKLHEQPSQSVNEDFFRTVVRTAFGKRRKTLRNSLKFLPFDEKVLTAVLSNVTVPLNVRAEALGVEQWVQLANEIDECRRAVANE